MYCVYKHTCPNGKVYIGITGQDPLRRWNNGKSYLKQKFFGSAILKYGWDNIKHEILFDGLSKEEACQKEVELIAKYKSNNKNYGYNLSAGGEFGGKGVHLSKETRRKMSESRKGENNCNYGKHLSEETKQKLRVSHMRENLSEETLLKMSKANSGRCGEKHWNYGNKYTDEQRKKLSEAHKKCNQKYFSKKVICVETKTVYNSMKDAAQAINRSQGNITTSIKAGTKCGGYHWQYAEGND